MSQTIDLKVEYTNKLAQENEVLRAQVDALTADFVKQLDELSQANYKYRFENNELKAQVEHLREFAALIVEWKEYGFEKAKTLLDSTPAQCLAEIKAHAVSEVWKHFNGKFRPNEKLTVMEVCVMLNNHIGYLRQQAKGE